MWALLLCILALYAYHTNSQRQSWPVNDYDMSMHDAAELCYQLDRDKSKTDTTKEQYMPPKGTCYFYQYIYCPNVPEDPEHPCGWWMMKPCNISMLNREPHFSIKAPNPDTKVDFQPIFFGSKNETEGQCGADECPNTPCANGYYCLNCVCTSRYLRKR